MPLSIKEIKLLQERFDKMHGGRKPFFEKVTEENIEVLEHLIVCLVGEVGEFSNIVKKISRGDFTYNEKIDELKDELADIFIYLIKISNQSEIDLEKCFLEKLEKNQKRFERYEINEDI
ncbi:MazG nucleotide pyrophosphohydrolase domain-containing protein [Paenibacillus sp. PL2-23]|uniref:MazG nucleotide pyrophosphohydrolase domain-containing protein n=1 Tax=Paenibacillus sp. PL2-23 TaxID=2100729 RepID=UPI0030FA35EB